MDDLKSIAHRAMLDRGLLPDFAPAVLTQVNAISAPATTADPSVRGGPGGYAVTSSALKSERSSKSRITLFPTCRIMRA